jgi:hypothetical protein
MGRQTNRRGGGDTRLLITGPILSGDAERDAHNGNAEINSSHGALRHVLSRSLLSGATVPGRAGWHLMLFELELDVVLLGSAV